ncbi:plant basic secretory protein, partial [Cryphonectria parasitica EP155]
FKLPKLRLNVPDLAHPGASRLLSAIDTSAILAESVQTVLRLLYQKPSPSVPGTRSVTLYLEDMGGVAYTKGSDLDDDHKEIHFSLRYIHGIKKAPEGAKGDTTGAYEIRGVLVHELVHCFQYNGRGTCPGGLIEGIADWVRLKAHLGAPHWKRDSLPERWDQGYEKTAYFLEWLEAQYGEGTVRRVNETLRTEKYDKDQFWNDLFGAGIDTLWQDYKK